MPLISNTKPLALKETRPKKLNFHIFVVIVSDGIAKFISKKTFHQIQRIVIEVSHFPIVIGNFLKCFNPYKMLGKVSQTKM